MSAFREEMSALEARKEMFLGILEAAMKESERFTVELTAITSGVRVSGELPRPGQSKPIIGRKTKGSETRFTEVWQKLHNEYFASNPGLLDLMKAVRIRVFNELKSIKLEYQDMWSEIRKQYTGLCAQHKQALHSEEKVMTAYVNLCKKIEAYRKKGDTQKFVEYKGRYRDEYTAAETAMNAANELFMDISTQFQVILVRAEQEERKMVDRMSGVMRTMEEVFTDYKQTSNAAYDSFPALLQQGEEGARQDFSDMLGSEVRFQKGGTVIPCIVDTLPFRMEEFVSPQDLFGVEIGYWGARVKENTTVSGINITVDTPVLVVGDEKDGNVRCRVGGSYVALPQRNLRADKSETRMLLRVGREHVCPKQNWKLAPGQIVLCVKTEEDVYICQDTYLVCGPVPKDKLTVYQ